jgi:hypothetical protein
MTGHHDHCAVFDYAPVCTCGWAEKKARTAPDAPEPKRHETQQTPEAGRPEGA